MEISSTRSLCQNLIALAIQRCRISKNLCRLSIVLKIAPDSDPPITRIAISDTGVGSSLAEYRDLYYSRNHITVENWDGMLNITTTSTDDKEVYHYRLKLKETMATRKLTRLPSTPKKGVKFSGTEVSLVTHDRINDLMAWITCFCQKMVIVKVPKLAVELLVEHMDDPGSRCEQLLQSNDGIFLPLSMANIERLTAGLEDFVLRHGNMLDKECQGCYPSRDNLKVGSGVACGGGGIKSTGQMMEAVIAITEVPEPENPSRLRAHGAATKVLFFQDFSPHSIPQPSLKALTSVDWQSYGLTLRTHIVDGDGEVMLEWDELPPFTHIDVALHCYQRKWYLGFDVSGVQIALYRFLYMSVMMLQTQQRYPVDRNLVKRALKLALDNLKEKYPGILLSPHALKIQRYAPNLSKAIAGLILSSNDSEFQGECASLLGLHHLDIGEEGKFESCIRDRINEIIAANDRKPKRGKDRGPCLFENHTIHEEDCQDDEAEYEGDIDLDL